MKFRTCALAESQYGNGFFPLMKTADIPGHFPQSASIEIICKVSMQRAIDRMMGTEMRFIECPRCAGMCNIFQPSFSSARYLSAPDEMTPRVGMEWQRRN